MRAWLLDASRGSAAADPAVTAYVLALAALELALPSNGSNGSNRCVSARRRRSQRRNETGAAAAWRGCGDGVAAGGGGGDVHEAVVVGGSVQVGDVLLGDDEGESGMHG